MKSNVLMLTATVFVVACGGATTSPEVAPGATESVLQVRIELDAPSRTLLRTIHGPRSSLELLAYERLVPVEQAQTPEPNGEATARIFIVLDGALIFDREVPTSALFRTDSDLLGATRDYVEGIDHAVRIGDPSFGIARRGLTAKEFCNWFAGHKDNGTNDKVYKGCTWFLTGTGESR